MGRYTISLVDVLNSPFLILRPFNHLYLGHFLYRFLAEVVDISGCAKFPFIHYLIPSS
jgi:hypothetical protein